MTAGRLSRHPDERAFDPPEPMGLNEASAPMPGLTLAAAGATPDRGWAHTSSWVIGYRRRLFTTDLTVIVLVVFSTQSIRFDDNSRIFLQGFGLISYWFISASLSAAWMAALMVNGAWDRKILGAGPSEYGRILRASFYLFGFVAIVSYLAKAEIARSYLAVAVPLGIFGLFGGRWVWRRLLEEYRRNGTHMSAVLVVGGTNSAVALATRLRGAPSAGFKVAGMCLPGGPAAWSENGSPVDQDFAVVGGLDDVAEAIGRTGADMVAIAASESFGTEEIRRLAWQLEGRGVAIALAPALTDVAGPRIHIRPVAGLPLLYVEEPRFRGPKLVAKAMLDLLGAICLIIISSPLLLGVALAIKISDRGPVFFLQDRVGIGGKSFRVWKFRSMVVGAEGLLPKLAEGRGEVGNEVLFKMKDDPRITRVGKILRRFSVDEVPQLFNVLRGEMSLVGPRPPLPAEVDKYGDAARRRLLVKPGMTGLWQVSGRSDLSWEDSVRLDVYYVENWSVAGDLVIMARTVRAVIGRHGAY